MARMIRGIRFMMDGEIHFSDTICWCEAEHSLIDDTFYHYMAMDKGVTYFTGYARA